MSKGKITLAKFEEALQDARSHTYILEECLAAVIQGDLNLGLPHITSLLDGVTTVRYYAVNIERAHGGIVLAVTTAKQADGQPTITIDARYINEVSDRYRNGSLYGPGRLHYEQLAHAIKRPL